MSVGLLIITHNDIGKMLLETAIKMMNICPLESEVLSVPFSQDVDNLIIKAGKLAEKLESGDGVLVLTDVYGSTPSNIASSLADNEHVRVIAGINLPMLIRVLNYPRLNLSELTIKALSGGRDGVLVCSPEDKHHLMKHKQVKIINKLGLHARAAAKFVTLASEFEADIKLTRNNRTVSGKSIMGVMMLAASKGTIVEITASGHDQDEAITKLEALINRRFDEDE